MKAMVKEATGRTRFGNIYPPDNVLDNDATTFYHSGTDNKAEWLKLKLAKESKVDKVVIVNRYLMVVGYIARRR